MSSGKTLSREEWGRAAIDEIASGGVDAVSVEGLARRLDVTKGSFYWHFANRTDLIEAALALWEREATTCIIDELSTIDEPRRRLSELFELSFGDTVGGAVDAALLARVDDPVVGPVVHRVHVARLQFLETAFADLGMTPSSAARQARITYATYVGHFAIRRALPDDPHLGAPTAAYLRQLLTGATTASGASFDPTR